MTSGGSKRIAERAARLGVAAWVIVTFSAGCRSVENRVKIVNYRGSGEAERFGETFDEAYYDVDARGNVVIVLRVETQTDANPSDQITQIVHIETFWRCIPGRTIAQRTQLNGTVTYCIVGPAIAATFEGAGSIFCSHPKNRDELIGSIELARLKPVRQVMSGAPVFEHAELSGTFRARRDRRRVVRLVNEIDRVFGPSRSTRAPGARPGS